MGLLTCLSLHTVCFLKGETSGFPSQTHPFPESLCVTPKWRVLPLIIAPAFVLRCNTGSITSGTLTSHLAYCSTSVHPRDFCRFGFCSYRAKVHSHAVLRARTLTVLASARDQTVIGSLCLQTIACRLRGYGGEAPVKGGSPSESNHVHPFCKAFFEKASIKARQRSAATFRFLCLTFFPVKESKL